MWDGAKNGRASMRVRISKIMFIRKYKCTKLKKNIITYSFTVEKVTMYSNDPHICKPLICKHSLLDKYGFTICFNCLSTFVQSFLNDMCTCIVYCL